MVTLRKPCIPSEWNITSSRIVILEFNYSNVSFSQLPVGTVHEQTNLVIGISMNPYEMAYY